MRGALKHTQVLYNTPDLRPSFGPSRNEHRKLRSIAMALRLNRPALLDYEKLNGFGERRYSFRALAGVYPGSPFRLAFEQIAGLAMGNCAPLGRFLRGKGGPMAEVYLQVIQYFADLGLPPKPAVLIVPGAQGGFAVHESPALLGKCYSQRLSQGYDNRPHTLYLQTFADFLGELRDLWKPAEGTLREVEDQSVTLDINAEICNRLREKQIGNGQLAEVLRVSPAFISMLLSGKKKWPSSRAAQALAWLATLE